MAAGYDFLFKYIIVGDSGEWVVYVKSRAPFDGISVLLPTGVGKSCLLIQFANNRFQAPYIPTIGAWLAAS